MNALTLASDPKEAAAVEAVETHHARLAGELAGRVAMLITAADRDPATAGRIRDGLVDFCDREILPHATAEEETLYRAAHGTVDARLLVESLIAEHHCLIGLVDALRTTTGPTAAATEARALQVLFEEHVAKENGLVLPLLAVTPGVSLAALLGDMREALAASGPARTERDAPDDEEDAEACCGGCACGAGDEEPEPELDVREVPHAIRHATVFGALDAVPSGSALVLVAPHDPVPLLAQIEQRHPGRFEVTYLERGPRDWRLRLSHR
ncbi:DUF2249 domain-containing protein [Streptomyces sp. NPDC008313]|uniref:DUF2249 domain-containing protein n=1 Tax=Streptomyces sp. NPDC008313 TaxID=3364826 RepID=UPI0036E17093